MKDNNQLVKITRSAILMALTCVLTLIIRIPTPTKGYVNLGDCAVLISGWLLGPVYGTIAGGVGSALADLISGYPLYIPGTFVIKGLMAFVISILPKALSGKEKKRVRLWWIVSAVVSEIIMISGYYLYEAVIIGIGFVPALAGVLGNAMQGLVGIVSAYILAESLSRTDLCKKLNIDEFKKDGQNNER